MTTTHDTRMPTLDTADVATRPRRRPRRATIAALISVALVIGAGVAAALGLGGASRDTAGTSTLPPATTKVTRQTLVDQETKDGELGYGTTHTVGTQLAGTVTWLPDTGSTVARGQALYRVNDTPVVLLYGTLPAYRTLRNDVSGADVKAFEQNLRDLGYTGFTVDEDYTSATADAVERWQDDLGLDQTGRVERGRIIYATGQVRIDSQATEVGSVLGQGGAVLSFAGTDRVITATIDVDDQRLARKDATVTITLPDGGESTGRISTVETIIETAPGSSGKEATTDTKIEVTITSDDPTVLAAYDQASVEVAFTASERENVLTVPVSALLALAEGGFGLQLVEGSTTRMIAVRTGLFASGRVEVSGDAVAEGLTVGMPDA
ncbi:MAG: efflux RND transporter periplasmic adaptor subunit [Dactylosporangium sp.]|nr:efflux RND transporter periplasmic adaptor subunit [Dactylosporangium sp.]